MPTLFDSIPKELSSVNVDQLLNRLIDLSITAGKHLIAAALVYIVGQFLVRLITHLVTGMMQRRNVDPGVQTFLHSFLKIVLTILVIVSVIGALGVNTASFAALLASAGVAVGMALSGHLQNFAGGIVVLVFKPFRVGDFVEAQGVSGTVTEIRIFHTLILTPDHKSVFVPNGQLSNSVVTNYSHEEMRRVQWTVGVDYGENIDAVRQKLTDHFLTDSRILQAPEAEAPFIGVDALADSSVNLIIRVWVKTADYWPVFYQEQQAIYDLFNREGINIPYPQTVVHVEK